MEEIDDLMREVKDALREAKEQRDFPAMKELQQMSARLQALEERDQPIKPETIQAIESRLDGIAAKLEGMENREEVLPETPPDPEPITAPEPEQPEPKPANPLKGNPFRNWL